FVAADGSSARGCQLAFANPIGMYIRSFNSVGLTHGGNPVPASWTKLSRGRPGHEQRLEFGPPDDEPLFLDDIVVEEGAAESPLTGGYQLAKRVEVGPKVVLGPDRDFTPAWAAIPADPERLDCSQADICTQSVQPAKAAYEAEHGGASLRGRG
ncbi:MAG TPA: hypothetical protein VN601_03800, partial [Arthrobacter sp.]|nr:hypothetical protein [Arthrobacter sp.]